ncbi:Adhesion G-protein coupled receptor D1 [Trichoplax sp. H2]|nr:Adhesion G-protein coupled receptor D1 [Trichoplax sp. H2]|eukprot:RDD44469.1 Adhesion G-protein coupled receptor D1 [Trichoplax sp. H2]
MVCPENFTFYESLCYGPHLDEIFNFPKARNECLDIGGDLAKLDSPEKFHASSLYLQEEFTYWIGARLTNSDPDDGWRWVVDKEHFSNITYWYDLQSFPPSHHCAAMEYKNGFWNFILTHCLDEINVLCQIEPNLSNNSSNVLFKQISTTEVSSSSISDQEVTSTSISSLTNNSDISFTASSYVNGQVLNLNFSSSIYFPFGSSYFSETSSGILSPAGVLTLSTGLLTESSKSDYNALSEKSSNVSVLSSSHSQIEFPSLSAVMHSTSLIYVSNLSLHPIESSSPISSLISESQSATADILVTTSTRKFNPYQTSTNVHNLYRETSKPEIGLSSSKLSTVTKSSNFYDIATSDPPIKATTIFETTPTDAAIHVKNLSTTFHNLYDQLLSAPINISAEQATNLLTNLTGVLNTDEQIKADDLAVSRLALLQLSQNVDMKATTNHSTYFQAYFSAVGQLTSKSKSAAWAEVSKKIPIVSDILNITDGIAEQAGRTLAPGDSYQFNSKDLTIRVNKYQASQYRSNGYVATAEKFPNSNLKSHYYLNLPPTPLANQAESINFESHDILVLIAMKYLLVDDVVIAVTIFKSLQDVTGGKLSSVSSSVTTNSLQDFVNSLIIGCRVSPKPQLSQRNQFVFWVTHNNSTENDSIKIAKTQMNNISSSNRNDPSKSTLIYNRKQDIEYLYLISSDRFQIHTNLAFTMLISQIGILLGGWDFVKQNPVICKVVAIGLHYFLLAMFSWMLMEALHLYFQIISVFNTKSRLKLYYILGWGAPAVIVGTAVGLGHKYYGLNQICWLSLNNGMIWAFTGPALFVIAVNFVVMVLIIKVTFNKAKIHQNDTGSTKKQAKTISKALLILLPILGLTWIFGILSTNDQSIIFSYIFVILNGLQGLLFFVCHCLWNSEVRILLKRKLGLTSKLSKGKISSEAVISTMKGLHKGNKRGISSIEKSSDKSVTNIDGVMYHAVSVPTCPSGYEFFGGLCYGIENYGLRTFTNAEIFCAGLGGKVVAPNSSERLAAATSGVQNNKLYWLNLYDTHNLNGPNDFVWLNLNKTTGTYTNWETNEPNVAGYRCVIIGYVSGNWKWKTHSCTSKVRTICELCTSNTQLPTPTLTETYTLTSDSPTPILREIYTLTSDSSTPTLTEIYPSISDSPTPVLTEIYTLTSDSSIPILTEIYPSISDSPTPALTEIYTLTSDSELIHDSSTTTRFDTALSSEETLYDSLTYDYSISSPNLTQSSLYGSAIIIDSAFSHNMSATTFFNAILSSEEILGNSLTVSNVILSPTNVMQSLLETSLFSKESMDGYITPLNSVPLSSFITQASPWSESIYCTYGMSVSISSSTTNTTITSISISDEVASTLELRVETSASEVVTGWTASISIKSSSNSSLGINGVVVETSGYSEISMFDSIQSTNANINATVVISPTSASDRSRDILLPVESSQRNGAPEFLTPTSHFQVSSLEVAVLTTYSATTHPNDSISATNLSYARTSQAASTNLLLISESTIKQKSIYSMSSINSKLLQSQNTSSSPPVPISSVNILTTSVPTQANITSTEAIYMPATVAAYTSNISAEFLYVYNQISKNQTSFTRKQCITILTDLQKALKTNSTINVDDLIIAREALLKLNHPVNLNDSVNQTDYAKVYFSTLSILTSKHDLNAWRETIKSLILSEDFDTSSLEKKVAISADVLNATDQVAKVVSHVLAVNQSFIFKSPNLDVDIVKESSSIYINHGFFMQATEIAGPNSMIKYSLKLPPSDLATETDNVAVSVSVYKSLQYIMNKQIANADIEGSNQLSDSYLNSAILGCTVTPKPMLNDSNPFTFTLFLNKANFTSAYQPTCVFWEFAANSESSGNWSDRGCSVVYWNQTHTHCQCNHLTHFAILMRITKAEISQEHLVNLDTLTYICSGTSIIALFLSIIILSMVRTMSDHHEIHINLALAMLLSQIAIVLTGASIIKNNDIFCKILAIALHVFLLSMFSWMLTEGIHLYLKVITVFNTNSKRKLYYIMGWGFPIITVSITVGIGFDKYGLNKLCWLSVSSGFIWAFTGPALFVILPGRLSASCLKDEIQILILLNYSNPQGCFFFSFHCLYNSEVRLYLMRRVGLHSSSGSQSIALSTSNRNHPKVKITSNVREFDVTEDLDSNRNLIYEDRMQILDSDHNVKIVNDSQEKIMMLPANAALLIVAAKATEGIKVGDIRLSSCSI